MTNSTLEDRLRSHYASVADRLVLSESDFDDVPLIPVRTAQARSPRWRPVVAVAASIAAVAGLGYVAFRPDHTVTPANAPVPPQTLAGETEEQGSQRVWTACMIEHGITLGTRGADGGLPFSGPDEATTMQAVDDCQAVLVAAGFAEP
jgi:hypothetical protein